MSNRNANNSEMGFSMDDVPPMSNGLADGDPLQAFVPAWGLQFLQIYNTRTAKTALTALTTPAITKAAPEPPTQRLKRLSLNPNKPCRDAQRRNTTSRDAMACPYHKRNPKLYHSCGYAVSIRNARAARHHVVINHHAPIYCAVCHSGFPSAVARDEHERRRSCTQLERTGESIEGVTADQVPKLLQRDASQGPRRMHENEEESWFRMWDILFPGVERPQTAYLSSPEERQIVALRRFWKRAGPTLVKGLLGEGADEATLQAVQASILEMIEQAGLR